eukprot:235631-Chlamydomonas_euryale.AAC.2
MRTRKGDITIRTGGGNNAGKGVLAKEDEDEGREREIREGKKTSRQEGNHQEGTGNQRRDWEE